MPEPDARRLLSMIFRDPDPASDEDRFLDAMYVAAGVVEDVPDSPAPPEVDRPGHVPGGRRRPGGHGRAD